MVTLELKNIEKTFFLKKKEPFLFNVNAFLNYFNKNKGTSSNKKGFKALTNINLKIYENEIIGILGKNGAGKSTLMNLIYGLIAPSSGQIITSSRITALFGFGSCFNQELTGRENIYLTGTAYGIKKKEIDRHIHDIIKFSEIEEIDVPLKFYSNGMKARLGFSIIAYIDTDVLILDEALTGGDVFFQKKCIIKLKEIINKPNKTFIIVSHSENLIKELCTKAIVMKKGEIVFEGDTLQALSFYKQEL